MTLGKSLYLSVHDSPFVEWTNMENVIFQYYNCRSLLGPPWQSITNWVAWNNKSVLSHSSGGWKSSTHVSPDLVPSLAIFGFLWLVDTSPWPLPSRGFSLYVQISPFCKDIDCFWWGPALKVHFNSIPSIKPYFQRKVKFWDTEGKEFMYLGAGNPNWCQVVPYGHF